MLECRRAQTGAAMEATVQLTACSRVRPATTGLLTGAVPGSAAAAAALNLYTGSQGERSCIQRSSPDWSRML